MRSSSDYTEILGSDGWDRAWCRTVRSQVLSSTRHLLHSAIRFPPDSKESMQQQCYSSPLHSTSQRLSEALFLGAERCYGGGKSSIAAAYSPLVGKGIFFSANVIISAAEKRFNFPVIRRHFTSACTTPDTPFPYASLRCSLRAPDFMDLCGLCVFVPPFQLLLASSDLSPPPLLLIEFVTMTPTDRLLC